MERQKRKINEMALHVVEEAGHTMKQHLENRMNNVVKKIICTDSLSNLIAQQNLELN
jgi:type IV secretory pathway VirD2 relaxase